MKLIVVSLRLSQGTRGNVASLVRIAEQAMLSKHPHVTSNSGATAAASVNFCERMNMNYVLTCMDGMYHVEAKR